MTEIGEIRRAREIGRLGGNGSLKYMWCSCLGCGKERWVEIRKGIVMSLRCRRCALKNRVGASAPRWKGGRSKNADGYVWIRLYPDDFFFAMTSGNGRVFEHRLVMAKHLHRCLLTWEVVHHVNGIRDDNRIENLKLLRNDGNHNTRMEATLKRQAKEIKTLKDRIKQWERLTPFSKGLRLLYSTLEYASLRTKLGFPLHAAGTATPKSVTGRDSP